MKFYKKRRFFHRQRVLVLLLTISEHYYIHMQLNLHFTKVFKKTVFDMFFFYCPSMAYKEILSQDVKTFSCIKEGNVNCPLLIDPRQGRAFCKVSIGHIFFLFLLGKNRHKMYLRHILCIKDIFNFECFLLSVCL